jgi:hypothetical protein
MSCNRKRNLTVILDYDVAPGVNPTATPRSGLVPHALCCDENAHGMPMEKPAFWFGLTAHAQHP